MLQLFNKLHEEWPKAYLYSVRLALFHCFSSFEKEKEIKHKLSTFHLFSIKLDKTNERVSVHAFSFFYYSLICQARSYELRAQ